MTFSCDPAEAAPIDLRDITVADRVVRISASPTNATATIFELVNRVNPVFLGHLVAADSKSPGCA